MGREMDIEMERPGVRLLHIRWRVAQRGKLKVFSDDSLYISRAFSFSLLSVL